MKLAELLSGALIVMAVGTVLYPPPAAAQHSAAPGDVGQILRFDVTAGL